MEARTLQNRARDKLEFGVFASWNKVGDVKKGANKVWWGAEACSVIQWRAP
jgi:hypothetical protein